MANGDENKKNLEEQKKFNKAKEQEIKHTKETGKELLSQRQALNDLLKLQKEGNEYKKETLGMSRDLAKFEQEELVFKQAGIELLRSEQDLSKALLQDTALRKQLKQKVKDLEKAGNVDQAKNLAAQLKTTKSIGKNIKKQIKDRASINKHLGMTDNIMRGLEQIPFFKEFIDGEAIIGKAEKAIHGMEDESKKSSAGMKAAFGEAFQQLNDNSSAIGKVLSAWTLTSILKDAIELSTQVTQVQKSLNLSDKASRQLNNNFLMMSHSTRTTGIAVSDIRNTFMSLNEQLGISTTAIRDDIVQEMAILSKYTGLSAESQARFAQDAILSGKKAHEITTEARATVEAQAKQFGLGVDVNKILDEAGQITGVMAANFGFSITKMAKLVTQSKQLGISLEQTKSIQAGMLDFASSIENELAAELFTGKQLNLEKARLYALTNDYTNLQKEIVKQFPSIIEFEKMNYFAKERTAAALGLTADGMADILRDGKTNKELAKEAEAAGEKELQKMYEKRGAAEDLANAQQVITESLVNMMTPLLPLVEAFANMLTYTELVGFAIGAIVGVKFLGLINSVLLLAKAWKATAIASAIAKAAANPLTIPLVIGGMAVAGAAAGYAISSNTPSKNDLSPMDVAQIQRGEVKAHSGESLIRTNTLEALLNKAGGGGNQQQNMQPVVLSVNYSGFDAVKAPSHYNSNIR